MVLMPRRGRGDEAESEDLPVKIHVLFFGLKNDMSLGAKARGESGRGPVRLIANEWARQ